MKTTVVNIRRQEYDVYIGRAQGNGHDGYFGNSFTVIRDGGREKAIAAYREYFLNRLKVDSEFAKRVQELKGKRLGCFCKPENCHGYVIAEYLDQPPKPKKPMKVVVCGGRGWSDRKAIFKRLFDLPSDSIVVEGGCHGADTMVREVALDLGLEVVTFWAAWKKYGKSAGHRRNIKMLNTGPGLVIAFHNDLSQSKGTKHTVTEARKRGIETEVIGSGD